MKSAGEALTVWRELAEQLGRSGDHDRASWAWLRLARLEAEVGGEEVPERSFQRAIEEAAPLGDERRSAHLKGALARHLEDRSRFEEGKTLYQEVLAAREGLAGASLATAATLVRIGSVAWQRGDVEGAEPFFHRALALRQGAAPGSLEVAASQAALGLLAWAHGNLSTTEERYREALAIQERLAPESLDVADSWTTLGIVAFERHELRTAEERYRRALGIYRRLTPEGIELATCLSNLGVVAWRRGELAQSEDLYFRALRIYEQRAPGSMGLAKTLNNLGLLAGERGDLAAAESRLRASLEIKERLAPESAEVALVLGNLGDAARHQGDVSSAEELHRRAIGILEELAPGSTTLANAVLSLARDVHLRGDLASAEALYRRGLESFQELAPGSLYVSSALRQLADLAERRGDLAEADRLLRRALAIRGELAPGSWEEADTLHRLGALERRRGRPEAAAALFARALDVLEAQSGRLGGGDEARGRFLTRHRAVFMAALDLLVERGRGAEAFGVLERSRARGLLALLAERDLLFADLPEELSDERRRVNAEHDRALDRLGRAAEPGAEDERLRLRSELDAVRRRRAEIQARIRAASPRFAALQYPEPLPLEGAQRALEPATLLLAYSIGEERSLLFLVGQDRFRIALLGTGLEQLHFEVERFRELWKPGDPGDSWIRAQSEQLGDQLLGPAAAEIAAAERLIVMPDGPLHYLPFGALQDPGAEGFRYLIESKPVSVVASATVLAQLKADRKSAGARRVVAFADPVYPGRVSEEAGGEPVLRSVVRGGLDLSPLPGTRAEAEALRRLFPEGSELYLGEAASEAAAKRAGRGASILHFACHGLLDDRQPLSSALALSIPAEWQEGEENGLLQAWEVFEQVRIDADLVTLSGCATALGKESAGEGLLGLTRAFQFAGARTVLASLWSVSDESTAELMRRFYGHLRSGKPKDEALRRAQMELLRAPIEVDNGEATARRDFTHPFHWAAFQLIGDWR